MSWHAFPRVALPFPDGEWLEVADYSAVFAWYGALFIWWWVLMTLRSGSCLSGVLCHFLERLWRFKEISRVSCYAICPCLILCYLDIRWDYIMSVIFHYIIFVVSSKINGERKLYRMLLPLCNSIAFNVLCHSYHNIFCEVCYICVFLCYFNIIITH